MKDRVSGRALSVGTVGVVTLVCVNLVSRNVLLKGVPRVMIIIVLSYVRIEEVTLLKAGVCVVTLVETRRMLIVFAD